MASCCLKKTTIIKPLTIPSESKLPPSTKVVPIGNSCPLACKKPPLLTSKIASSPGITVIVKVSIKPTPGKNSESQEHGSESSVIWSTHSGQKKSPPQLIKFPSSSKMFPSSSPLMTPSSQNGKTILLFAGAPTKK